MATPSCHRLAISNDANKSSSLNSSNWPTSYDDRDTSSNMSEEKMKGKVRLQTSCNEVLWMNGWNNGWIVGQINGWIDSR